MESKIGIETYGTFVSSSMENVDETWPTRYSKWIRDESMEFLGQHGPGAYYLMPGEFNIDITDVEQKHPELKEKMLDELGDLLWFGFAVASKWNIDISRACAASLQTEPVGDVDELVSAAVSNASHISVPNKISIYFPELDESVKNTNLVENPFYVFNRVVARLCKAMDEGLFDIPPFSMTDLEVVIPIEKALGDYLNVLFYIVDQSLGSDIQTVISTNVAKLQHRQMFGKQ